jgi:hypothetical protein
VVVNVKMRGVSLAYREHDDGEDAFLVFHNADGTEEHLEWDFIVDAMNLRRLDVDAYTLVWSVLDAFGERGAPLDGIES